MPAFVVSVNGRKVCSIGLAPDNARDINIFWVGDPKKVEGDLICFHIGGPEGNENLRWSVPKLAIGDEVTIKIAEGWASDPPTSRTTVEQMDPKE